MAKDKKVQATKVKKQKWVAVKAPKFLNESLIGEVPCYEEATLIGRVMPGNMMTITGDVKKQSVTMKFTITDVKAGVAQTTPISLEVSPVIIKRHVRRNKDKVEESLVFNTKDGVKIRIKPLAITNTKAKSSALKALRATLIREVHAMLANKNYEDLYKEVLMNKVQKDIKLKLNKIFPVRIVEIRFIKMEKDKVKLSQLPRSKERQAEGTEEAVVEAEQDAKSKPKSSKVEELSEESDAETDN